MFLILFMFGTLAQSGVLRSSVHSRARSPHVGHVSLCMPRNTAQVFRTGKPRLSRLCLTRISTASSIGTTVFFLLECGALTRVGHLAQRSIGVRCSYLDPVREIGLEHEDHDDRISQSSGW